MSSTGRTETHQVARLWSHVEARGDEPVIYYRGETWSAARLCDAARAAATRMADGGIGPGSVVALCVDDSPATCAALLGAMRLGATAVLIGQRQIAELSKLLDLACVEHVVDIVTGEMRRHTPSARSELLETFRTWGHAGLVIFSSGSTGTPKAVLHDFERVLKKFLDAPKPGFRTLQFLPLHHMGGVNTLLGTLCRTGGLFAFAEGMGPAAVARLVEQAALDLLPVTPSFLNVFLATGPYAHDLSSVKLITYGAEPMPESLLVRVRAAFPEARVRQTYALTEIGALPKMRSRDDGSLWMRLDDAAFEYRVRDGLLHLRSEYAMVGYLNAPSPLDNEGWLNTGDSVIVDGEWMRVLGRASDLINVGGEKVFPTEVEDVLQRDDNVLDAFCFGEPDPLLGSRVVARVRLATPEEPSALRQRLRVFCLKSLARYKVPVRFEVSVDALGDHFKRRRSQP